MNNSIARTLVIDKSNLSGEFYFSSLVQEGFGKNLLLKSHLENIQIDSFELLRYKTKSYTLGDSSSVPVNIAESIMKSNLYTISLYLKTIPHPDDALDVLIKDDISLLYAKGRKIINRKLHLAKHMHEMVKSNLIKTSNCTYNETLTDGIDGFFKLYNADFQAYEKHITADYPTSSPITDLVGVEFIIEYLQRIYYENIFCKYFSTDNIQSLMYSYHDDFDDLVINLFEMIFTTSLGCNLLGLPFKDLKLYDNDLENLNYMLKGRSRSNIEALLYGSYVSLITELKIENSNLLEYMEISLDNIASNIYDALDANQPELAFISSKDPKDNISLEFSFGTKMDDSLFRETLDEILSCRHSSDRISLIFETIESLADLEDICLNANLSEFEFDEIFSKLAPVELAAFMHRQLKDQFLDDEDISASESLFRSYFWDFINALPKDKKCIVEKMSEAINPVGRF